MGRLIGDGSYDDPERDPCDTGECDHPEAHATGQADRDAGDACPHGHRLPENCGLCTGCDS